MTALKQITENWLSNCNADRKMEIIKDFYKMETISCSTLTRKPYTLRIGGQIHCFTVIKLRVLNVQSSDFR